MFNGESLTAKTRGRQDARRNPGETWRHGVLAVRPQIYADLTPIFKPVNLRSQQLQMAFVYSTMRKTALFLLTLHLFYSCSNKKDAPDVSKIEVNIPIERFDRAFFKMDTSNISLALHRIHSQYPDFYNDFMREILGVSGAGADSNTISISRRFLQGYSSIFDSIFPKYKSVGWLKKELEDGYRYVKYYFPQYKTGKAVLYVGPFDAPGVATTSYGIAIGLQQFAGKDFSVYQTAEAQEMFPLYISRRFSPEYITANAMKAVVLELFPDQSAGKPLIEQMVEKGKQWWLLEKFLPYAADSVKTGFTQAQLDWCEKNEGLIWTEIVRNEDLNSINPTVIQTYIGEGPFTQGFPQEESPGNIGQWIGWQIVKKFADKNPDMKPEDLMKTPARKILDEAKYKPK
jgi:hypothetical protein